MFESDSRVRSDIKFENGEVMEMKEITIRIKKFLEEHPTVTFIVFACAAMAMHRIMV